MFKKILRFTGILLLLVIIAVIAIPYFFKDEILTALKDDINKSVNAEVDFSNVNLSLLGSFPNFTLEIEDMSIIGKDDFEGYPLLKVKNANFTLDVMSVVNSSSDIEIKSINLIQPEINIKVLRNGKANYDITTSTDTTTTAEADLNFKVQLQEYNIEKASFTYDDKLGGSSVKIENLNHKGEGEFTQDIFDLNTKTSFDHLTAKSGGIAYLNKAKGDIDLVLKVDLPNNKYTIKENTIRLNALKLLLKGFAQLDGNAVKMDLKYSTPQNKFKNFLSLIPSAYTSDFQDVQADGDLKFNGYIKGTYNMDNGALPSFAVNFAVNNANIKYPDLPLGIQDVKTTASIISPGSNMDKMLIDISEFKMKLGNNPFDASLKLKTPISNPDIDTKINGTIDLEELAKAFPIDGIDKLNGIITSNLQAKTSMAAIDNQDFDNIDMAGALRIENMNYKSVDMPAIQIKDMQMDFTPKHVELDRFDAKLGRSDIKASGKVDNILAYFSPEKTMTGELVMRSELFDSNEWIPDSEETTAEPNVAEEVSTEVFDRFDFKLDGQVNKLIYDIYELKNVSLVGQVTPNRADIKEFKTDLWESDFSASGNISNIFNYLYDNQTLAGDIKLVSNYINLNEFMTETEVAGAPKAEKINESSVAEIEAVLVPEKMDFNIDANINKVLYTNIEMRNINGMVKVKDETVSMDNCKAKSLGGSIIMNGTYETKNPEEPKFDMDYQVERLDFQDAFDKLNTFAALAPVGKFIEGKFNTNLKLSGTLGKDMFPDLNTLSASGFIQTLNSTLHNFAPLEKLGEKLNIKALKKINLENTKNWFEVNDGKVTVKEFDFKTSGIDMVVGGSHGFDTDMSYNIKAKVPRKLLQDNAVGQATDKGLKFLEQQASKLGIDIKQSEFVNLSAAITGTMKNPKIKINLLGADGEAVTKDNIINAVKEEAIDKVAEVVEEKTGIDITKMNEEIALARTNLQSELDEKVKKITDSSEKEIKSVLAKSDKEIDNTKKKAIELAEKGRQEGYKQADALIKKAGSNIIKKQAAKVAAKKLKDETDKKTDALIKKAEDAAIESKKVADKQADSLREKREDNIEKVKSEYNKKMDDEEAKIRARYEQ